MTIHKLIIKQGSRCGSLKNISVIVLVLLSLAQTSCKKRLEIAPASGSIADANVFTNESTAIAVLTGIYTNMGISGPFTGNKSITLLGGLSADELTLYGGVTSSSHIAYFQNALSAVLAPIAGSEQWPLLYNYIFKCNAAIEGLISDKADGLRLAIRQQLLGEAKFLRAFCYFYLINLYGEVPLALTTDAQIITLLARSPKEVVYQQIIEDCRDAQILLSTSFLDGSLLKTSAERVRPTKWAATALLARVFLYSEDWKNAEAESGLLISNTSLFSLSSLNSTFLKSSLNNNEAIWQIQPTTLNFNTQEARTFVITSTGPTNGAAATNPVYLSPFLLNSFEANDQRFVDGNWIKGITVSGNSYRYPFKYKVNALNSTINATTVTSNMTEFLMMLRLGEQYLIRAEARVQLGNTEGAKSDLNIIRSRALLPNTTANDKVSLLSAILHERQVELFCEMAHRWFDLKRTGNIDIVMKDVTPLKANNAAWQSYQAQYPLPQTDLDKAPNLMQNDGY